VLLGLLLVLGLVVVEPLLLPFWQPQAEL
jgi:hypothetical protein